MTPPTDKEELNHVLQTIWKFPPKSVCEIFFAQQGLNSVQSVLDMPDHFFRGAKYQLEDGTYRRIPMGIHMRVAWLRAFMILREKEFNPVCNWMDITRADWELSSSQMREQSESDHRQYRLDFQKHQALNAAVSSSIKASVKVVPGIETVAVSSGIEAVAVSSGIHAVAVSSSTLIHLEQRWSEQIQWWPQQFEQPHC